MDESLWLQVDPTGEDALVACDRKKSLARLRRIDLGPGAAERIAADLIGQMAEDIERPQRAHRSDRARCGPPRIGNA